MHSEIAIAVAAPAELVFALAHDVERWATLLPHYARSSAVRRTPDGRLVADFVARRPIVGLLGLGLPVAWRSVAWNEPDRWRLRFHHVGGVTRGMDVVWRIEPADDGCRVTIEHDFRPRVPGLASVVDRWFTRAIAGRTLATFKALAEAIAPLEAPRANRPADPTP